MRTYEVTITTTMSIYSGSFQDAADMAVAVAKGDRGKPDNCHVKSVTAEQVRLG